MTDDRIKEYNEILSECRRFARNEIKPGALEKDLIPESGWTLGLWQKSQELDIPGLMLPEKYNGSGYPEICGAYVLDAMAMECAGVASLFAHHFAACLPLSQVNGEKSRLFSQTMSMIRLFQYTKRPKGLSSTAKVL
jgi:alkylation response protein AidB-like acyl-CoA dehydrogenase